MVPCMGEIEFRDFDGDLEALQSMAADSWMEEYGVSTWPDLYRTELARHFFADVEDPRYLIGAYDGAKLVAFVANLPRNYRLRGRVYKAALSCMLVGHKDYRRRGIALNLIKECIIRNEDIGIDFALMTLEKKHRSALLFEKHIKPQHRFECIKRMFPITRPIDFDTLAANEGLKGYERAAVRLFGAHRALKAPRVDGNVRPYREGDLPAIHEMTQKASDQGCLVRIFSIESLARQLDTGGVTRTVVYERDGRVAGFANITYYDLVGSKGAQRWAWLDYLVWDRLAYKEKKALMAGVWEAGREGGCIGIMEWNKGYYRSGPLYRMRFVPYPRFLGFNAWIFNPDVSFEGMKAIFDQQI
jgi:GNAT superfamily N-acetyltransferase